MIKGKPLFDGIINVAAGSGTIPLDGVPFRRLLSGSQVAMFIKQTDTELELVYDPGDTTGHTIPVVAADGADFPAGSWRWGDGGREVPVVLKSSTDQAVRVLITEVMS